MLIYKVSVGDFGGVVEEIIVLLVVVVVMVVIVNILWVILWSPT